MDFIRPRMLLSQYAHFLAMEEARVQNEQKVLYKIFDERIAAIKSIKIQGLTDAESEEIVKIALRNEVVIIIDGKEYTSIDEFIDIDPEQIKEPCDYFDMNYGGDCFYYHFVITDSNRLQECLNKMKELDNYRFTMKFNTKNT